MGTLRQPALRIVPLISALLLLASPPASPDTVIKPDRSAQALIQQGLDHFYNLEYDEAIRVFERVISADPSAPEYYNYMAQAILYRELYRLGALESELLTGNNYFIRTEKVRADPKTNARLLANIDKAIQLAQALLSINPNDEDALYSLGSSYGLRMSYDFAIDKAWRAAASDISLARRYHARVLELDRDNYDAMLIQGSYDYAMGSLPWHARLLSYLVGRSGDKARGIRTIELVAEKGRLSRPDAQILLVILYRREKQPSKAVAVLDPLIRAYPRNYLLRMEKAHMFSDLGRKDAALDELREVEQLARSGRPEYAKIPLEKVYYAIGDVQFWYRDFADSLENMKLATTYRNLDLQTGVLAWMRQGQILDLMGRHAEAQKAYRQAIQFGPQTAAAQESRRYLNSPYTRAD
jgi:tetratricopeptide (TPR) repeat protein